MPDNRCFPHRLSYIFLPLVILILFISLQTNAQKLEYDIVWFGKIGTLTIGKTIDKNGEHIETKSEVKIPFYTFDWITNTTIKNGLLQTSVYEQLLNDEKREFNKITRLGENKWQVQNGLGEKKNLLIDHTFYVSQLYFTEPKNIPLVFSERFAKPLPLEDQGNGNYRLLLPDGNYCDYWYENGTCKMAKARNGNRNIKMVLVEP